MGWALDVLFVLGVEGDSVNEPFLNLWAQSEGMPDWQNNWLATTLDGYGGVDVNGVGVKAYPDLGSGVRATAASIDGGVTGSEPIAAALRAHADMVTLFRAVNESQWCAGCQGGQYPIAVYNAVASGLGQSGSGGGPIGPPAPADTGSDPVIDGLSVHTSFGNFRNFIAVDWPNYLTGLGWVRAAIDEN